MSYLRSAIIPKKDEQHSVINTAGPFGFFHHGNYCGPEWSSGLLQPSVAYGVDPVDSLDAVCQRHDAAFATDQSLSAANAQFVKDASNEGILGALMGTAVALTRPGESRLRGAERTIGGNSVSYGVHDQPAGDIEQTLISPFTMPPKKLPKMTRSKKNPKSSSPPVSTISTAPVSIGNTIRSVKPTITQSPKSTQIIGRDYAFTSGSTVAAATGWSLVGGIPITPAAFPSTILRSYTQMYSSFKVNRLVFHYITSSPTSQSGDVMFYYEVDRENPMIDITNNSFIPFVLSNPNSVLGPQWSNHSMALSPAPRIYSTSYGVGNDFLSEACGTVFLFSKTSSANSPGYVIMDYDITFTELSINPRAGILPVARAVWSQICLGKTALATTTGSTTIVASVQGINQDGTASALPSGAQQGDIYKLIALPSNSVVSGVNAAWTNITTSNMLLFQTSGANSNAVTLDDGTTLYACYTNGGVYLYESYTNACNDANRLFYGVTATVTYNLCCFISLLTSNTNFNQSAY